MLLDRLREAEAFERDGPTAELVMKVVFELAGEDIEKTKCEAMVPRANLCALHRAREVCVGLRVVVGAHARRNECAHEGMQAHARVKFFALTERSDRSGFRF